MMNEKGCPFDNSNKKGCSFDFCPLGNVYFHFYFFLNCLVNLKNEI